MKVSREWLQIYFEAPLPDATTLSDALTFHAFEIESIENVRLTKSNMVDQVLDVKVTPNRGHDCLSHRGIAKELAAILNIPFKMDPLRSLFSLEPHTEAVQVAIENPELCARYIAGYIRGITVGPSPDWLRTNLESIGQRSINNIVDAANYVMFNLGQPLHAFDASRLSARDGTYAIAVRLTHDENMLALDNKEYSLTAPMLAVTDAYADAVIGIAGVKGGKIAEVGEKTTDIVLEAANFDGASVRKTAQQLKLRTDASDRFQQVISPELAGYGMRTAADLIIQLAGGEIAGFVDQYPRPQGKREAGVSLEQVKNILGVECTREDIEGVLKRLDLPHTQTDDTFRVTVPFERLDIEIPEDIVEEVGRILGYDKIPATPLPPFPKKPEVNADFYSSERAREELVAKGYSEVVTSIFADKGDRAVSNKVDSVRPYLRANLTDGITEALTRNVRNKDLLGLREIKLFEIGIVWRGGKEMTLMGTASESEKATEKPLEGITSTIYDNLPLSTADRFHPFSRYPFIVRDIALWTPVGTKSEGVLDVIRATAGQLLIHSELFDTFDPPAGGRRSLAFRLVFQSFEKTLTDGEVSSIMKKVSAVLEKEGWEVR